MTKPVKTKAVKKKLVRRAGVRFLEFGTPGTSNYKAYKKSATIIVSKSGQVPSKSGTKITTAKKAALSPKGTYFMSKRGRRGLFMTYVMCPVHQRRYPRGESCPLC